MTRVGNSEAELGASPWKLTDLEAAASTLERAVTDGTPADAARHSRRLALLELAREHPERALSLVEQTLKWAATADLPEEVARARALRAEVRSWLGQAAEAEDEARNLLEQRAAPATARARAARALGRVAAGRRDTDGALRWYDEATSALRHVDDAGPELAVTCLDAAEALLDRDGPVDSSAAAARLAEARDHVDASRSERLRPRLALLLARARGATGDPDGAVDELERLLPSSQEEGRRDLEWQIAAALAHLHQQRGAEFLTRRAWERAVESLESIATGLSREHRESFWNDARRQQARHRAAGRGEPRPTVSAADPFADGRLARLLEVLKRLASEHDLDRLLERITDCAIELSGAERGFVLLTDPAGGTLLPRTVRDAGNPDDHPRRVQPFHRRGRAHRR